MISYRKLHILLLDRRLKLTNICKEAGLSSNIVTKLNNNESVTLSSLEKICLYLNCKIEDVVEITNDSKGIGNGK